MKNPFRRSRALKTRDELGDALNKTLVPARDPIKAPQVNAGPISETAVSLGSRQGSQGDPDSVPFGNPAQSVVAGVNLLKEDLGRQAFSALDEGTLRIRNSLAQVRAGISALPSWVLALIVLATIAVDSLAAHTALDILWNADPGITWMGAIATAGLLAATGWLLGIVAVKILGRRVALWVGFILLLGAVVGFAACTAQLRGATQATDLRATQVTAALDRPTPDQAQVDSAVAAQAAAEDDLAAIQVRFFGILIAFSVAVATLAKAYQMSQKTETSDHRGAARQVQRGRDHARAWAVIQSLHGWIPTAEEVAALGPLVEARYLDGFRSSTGADQLDWLAQNPYEAAVIETPDWIAEFTERLAALERELGGVGSLDLVSQERESSTPGLRLVDDTAA